MNPLRLIGKQVISGTARATSDVAKNPVITEMAADSVHFSGSGPAAEPAKSFLSKAWNAVTTFFQSLYKKFKSLFAKESDLPSSVNAVLKAKPVPKIEFVNKHDESSGIFALAATFKDDYQWGKLTSAGTGKKGTTLLSKRPSVQAIKHFQEMTPSGGAFRVAFDHRGRLTVMLPRIESTQTDRAGRALGAEFVLVSNTNKLTAAQKNAITGFLKEGELGSGASLLDACVQRGTSSGKKGLDFSINEKKLSAKLKQWAAQNAGYKGQVVTPKTNSVTDTVAGMSVDNRKALLESLLEADAKGGIKGEPGEIIATVGYFPKKVYDNYPVRWVLSSHPSLQDTKLKIS